MDFPANQNVLHARERVDEEFAEDMKMEAPMDDRPPARGESLPLIVLPLAIAVTIAGLVLSLMFQ